MVYLQEIECVGMCVCVCVCESERLGREFKGRIFGDLNSGIGDLDSGIGASSHWVPTRFHSQ